MRFFIAMFFIFIGLSIAYSWWFLIGAMLLIWLIITRWYHRWRRPWMRVHFPMMIASHAALGLKYGCAAGAGTQVNTDVRFHLVAMLHFAKPPINMSHELLVDRELERCLVYYDETLLREYMIARNIAPTLAADIAAKSKADMKTTEFPWMIRMVIAGVIEEQFSVNDRAEYIFEVFSGKTT